MPASVSSCVAEGVEVELAFEVVHAGLRGTIRRAARTRGRRCRGLSRAGSGSWAKSSISSSGERSTSLKVMMPASGCSHDLRAPAGLAAGVEALAAAGSRAFPQSAIRRGEVLRGSER